MLSPVFVTLSILPILWLCLNAYAYLEYFSGRELDYDYIVVGAGSAGLQMGVFLENSNASYVIYEKGPTAGSFWTRFPISNDGELISVNSQYKSLRYDWHSLLNTDVKFTAEGFFPKRKEVHTYLNKVAATLNVSYNTEVEGIEGWFGNYACVLLTNGEKRCARRVFVGTGLQEVRYPELEDAGALPYSKFNNSLNKGKRVCVLGNGNAGWEITQASLNTALTVSNFNRRPTRWSITTKYTGDVRIKYAQAMENFLSKLLYYSSQILPQAMLNLMTDEQYLYFIEKFIRAQLHHSKNIRDEKVQVRTRVFRQSNMMYDFPWACEVVYYAYGFRSTLPGIEESKKLFPSDVGEWYESDQSNVHYIGWHMHSHDFRRGAGGFVSGFRYLIRNLWKWVQEKDSTLTDRQQTENTENHEMGSVEEKHYDKVVGNTSSNGVPLYTREEIITHVYERLTVSASDIMIMQDGGVLRDIIELAVLDKEGDQDLFSYCEGCNYNFYAPERKENALFFYFGWKRGSRIADNMWNERFWSHGKVGVSNILMHPKFEFRGHGYALLEAILNNWYPDTDEIKAVVTEALDAMKKIANGETVDLEKALTYEDSGEKWSILNETDSGPVCEGDSCDADDSLRGSMEAIEKLQMESADPIESPSLEFAKSTHIGKSH